ncbi:phosphoribosylformylglycinamidine cyclo-ligase [Deinococcus soli (ex Cha et al. 2016)]|uniref:Phosphoribosylformylglycinamidine cyclo-ligase n=2 Tax=Deinococcus soli (ex Cha et al. 2016) TaxID=1309411 RepID=A0AAE4BK26_9DEIO|nr:phosphoribosylformylglycinamidine cyclo-ligase [Deinococcus soli (ex Cha et al. 2016)]MDR6216500.1 phosphoribosylformylglycinamidine cyclo-ligase [Deinococcus soli (ex Cha et al. 2016)]MDR6327321.1 phosphoribosylformylglycinamidine cyclo-ligase [Deinococcus soli (ex Cha et al. 2016)]MDR6749596.1 phosphoribosylformylglycinamidine cyclo-ligase [Deinococcus soli (ex Cha et al. 2016)]
MTKQDQGAQASAYERAGVSIDAGHRAVELMKGAVARTHTPNVLGGLGGFGGLFRAAFGHMDDPVLVASTDGVGTKTKVAVRSGTFTGLGGDIVNHCVNDILVQGARPLFFLDYVAMGKLLPERVAEVVTGAAQACEALGVALLGGETAEMPGVYVDGELDIVGTIVGVVDRPRLINGSRIQAGDTVLALPSSGLHTNGFSLARMALDDLDWQEAREDLNGQTLAQVLPVPHRAYLHAFDALERAGIDVRGMAHITGGGLIDNPPRVFPQGIGMQIDTASWTVPPVFELIVQRAQVARHEAFRALNMGVGFLFILPAAQEQAALDALKAAGEQPWVIGQMTEGQGVTFTGAV